jgi:ABC-2 type transport system ATP-binding protein
MNIIETRSLTKFYGKSRGIIDVDLKISEGEIFGFIGPNGAGKSTTIRTLLGLIRPTSGGGSIFGLDIVKDTKEIKKSVGFLPSEVNFYDKMHVEELLQYSARFYGIDGQDRIKNLAKTFSLDLDRRIIDLSRGNKKKVAILQCLIHRPRLLILDEPTSGLDPLMQAEFFNILKEVNAKGVTVFFSSHTLSEVQKMCKRVAIIKEGRILKVEDIEALRKKQLRKIQLEFESVDRGGPIDCEGIISPEPNNHGLSFMFSGRMSELLRALSDRNVADLIIEEPTLEEIFLHYYEDSNDRAEEAGGS